MMIAMWGLLDSRDLKSLNAPRTLLVSAANAVAVLTFVVAHAVHWPETMAMLVAAIVGGYGGAQIGRRAPPASIRTGTLARDVLHHDRVFRAHLRAAMVASLIDVLLMREGIMSSLA